MGREIFVIVMTRLVGIRYGPRRKALDGPRTLKIFLYCITKESVIQLRFLWDIRNIKKVKR